MLIDQIKADISAARNSQSPDVLIYSTLLGELQRGLSKPSDDVSNTQVIAVVRKTIKNNVQAVEDVKSRITDDNRQAATSYINKVEHENSVLNKYVPPQLDDVAIEQLIRDNGIKSLKDGMAFLSANYGGCYDGGSASKLLKTLFS